MPTPTAIAAFTALFTGDIRTSSRRLRRLMWQDSVAGLLDERFGPFGWNDGGCALLADATNLLAAQLAHRPVAIVDRSDLAQHVLIEVTAASRRWYVDADGICSRRALLHRWTYVELLRRPDIADLADTRISPGTSRDPEFSAELAELLGTRLAAT